MIVSPQNAPEWRTMANFLHAHAMVQPSPDLTMIGWVEDDSLQIVAGLNGFIGKVAQIHIAFAPEWHFSPRLMLRAVFRYAFLDRKLKLLVGILNSNNERAMKFDKHLGFRELLRLP